MKAKQLFNIIFLSLCGITVVQTQTQITAHRGCRGKSGFAQNSLFRLNNNKSTK